MISRSDITLRTYRDETIDATVHEAQLQLTAASAVSSIAELHSVLPTALHDVAVQEVLSAMWRKLYGDLREPLRELMFYAQKNATHDSQRVQELCSKINGMLAVPTE
jgi:hypothetical protein